MEDPQTLTVATTWKFDRNAAGHLRKLFRATAAAGVGFCKYESANNVVVVENCDIVGSASKIGNLVAKYIDDEKDNDLMEIPKVSRLGPPNAPYEITYDDDVVPEAKGTLIDFAQVSEITKIPVTTKYWKSNAGTTGGFERLRYAIDEVARLSGADVVLEESNSRIRVSSYLDSSIVDDAMNRLSNLQPCLSLSITPQVSHILHVSPETKYRLKLSAYSEVNSQAACRILVDRERKDIGRLSKMFVTVMVTRNSENQDDVVPTNLRKTPHPTKPTKGRPKIWADFKFQGLGEALNDPRRGDSVPEGVEPDQKSQLKINNALSTAPLADTPVGKHPYLTREKVSFVDSWWAAVEVGAAEAGISVANSTPPPNHTTEPAQSNLPPGIKRRNVVIIDSEGVTSAPVEASKAFSPAEASRVEDGKNISTDVAAQQGLRLPANFNDFECEQQKCSSSKNSRQLKASSPKSAEQRGSTQLIDLEDTSTMSKAAIPPIYYFQFPLIPTTARKASSTMENNYAEHVKQKEKVRSSGNTSGPPVRNRLRILEPEPRVFRRTMGQKAGNNPRMGKHHDNKAESRDNIIEAPGAPSILSRASTPCSSSFFRESFQLSEWKNTQQANEDEKRAATLNDFLQHVSRVLDGARCFPGAVLFEVQLGLILANRPLIENYNEVIFDTKIWNHLFQPKNNAPKPSTIFTNMLTTSGSDVDYILDLPDGEGAGACRVFSEEVLSRRVWYEFHCTTKNDETLVVTVDECGTAVVNRPESVLGAVNIHCAAQIWDMRGVVKGTIEYVRGDEEIDQAIQNLIGKLYIEPNLSKIVIFTRIPEGGQLDITKVLMKRSTRHRFHRHETGSLRKSTAKQSAIHDNIPSLHGDQGNECVSGSSGRETPLGIQEPILQVTEVQNLILGYSGDDKTVVRARAISADGMVADHRLWYEISVINPAIEEMLRSNKYLEFGNTTVSWSTFKPPARNEKRSTNTIDTAKNAESRPVEVDISRQFNNCTPSPSPTAEIRSKDVSEMFHAANKIVQKIDGVGWANLGPEAHSGLKADHAVSASMAAQSMSTAEEPTGFW